MVVIVDEGPGVPPERMSTLFDPFVRGADGGWGLGLAIARRAIGAHGGTIAARVAAPTGLAVTVTLPLATTPAD